MRTIISGGTVARHTGVITADVAFEDGRIVEVVENLPRHGAEVVDATGCIVMPGGVDAHTRMTAGAAARHDAGEGFFAGTLAAACGGTTCVAERPAPHAEGEGSCAPEALAPETLAPEALAREALERAQGEAVVDYAIHGYFDTAAQASDAPCVAALGAVSACVPGSALGDDAVLAALLCAARDAGLRLMAQGGNEILARHLAQALETRGETGAKAYPLARPALCEEEAVFRLLLFAEALAAPLCVARLSTAAALAHVAAARRRGAPVWAETCPQYLLLEEDSYADGAAEGLKYVITPPLRTRRDATALWEALKDGTVDVVSSDHCALGYGRKLELSGGNAFRCPAGVPGVETRLPLLFSEGVLKGRLTLPQFVRVAAEAPARLLGLKNKGRLEPGADADVVVLDPREEKTLTASRLHQQTDYTPYEGMVVRGWPRHVWLRGQRLVADGDFTGVKGCGAHVRATGEA